MSFPTSPRWKRVIAVLAGGMLLQVVQSCRFTMPGTVEWWLPPPVIVVDDDDNDDDVCVFADCD